jgi:antitoxin component of MazEF toxin-antitoxin module
MKVHAVYRQGSSYVVVIPKAYLKSLKLPRGKARLSFTKKRIILKFTRCTGCLRIREKLSETVLAGVRPRGQRNGTPNES